MLRGIRTKINKQLLRMVEGPRLGHHLHLKNWRIWSKSLFSVRNGYAIRNHALINESCFLEKYAFPDAKASNKCCLAVAEYFEKWFISFLPKFSCSFEVRSEVAYFFFAQTKCGESAQNEGGVLNSAIKQRKSVLPLYISSRLQRFLWCWIIDFVCFLC